MSESKQREEFEAWANDTFYAGMTEITSTWDEARGTYSDFAHHIAFKAWKAGQNSLWIEVCKAAEAAPKGDV